VSNPNKLSREQAADFGNVADVKLGDHEYIVVPQRIGYLRSKLGAVLAGVVDADLATSNVIQFLGDKVYSVLAVFIPDIMPEYEFHGYATREAMEQDKYDEEYDHSPSPTQVKQAISVCTRVNEIDLLGHLGKLIGPDVIQGWFQTVMVSSMQESLQNSLEASGAIPGTTSSTTGPISE
jgi:hypothetical protein